MSDVPPFLVTLESAFNAAMVSNDVERIGQCVGPHWLLVTPEVGPVSRHALLDAIAAGRLVHHTMEKKLLHAQVLGDMAWVTGRGTNTGTFNGKPMEADEWVTDIYQRDQGVWRCVLTHLTPVAR